MVSAYTSDYWWYVMNNIILPPTQIIIIIMTFCPVGLTGSVLRLVVSPQQQVNAVSFLQGFSCFCIHTYTPKKGSNECMNALGSRSHSTPATQSPIPAHQNLEISSCMPYFMKWGVYYTHYSDQSLAHPYG